jgi:mRNA interferase RelE/StbE
MLKKPGKQSASKMYSLQFLGKALKDLQRIEKPFQKIIKEKLLILARNPLALKNNIIKLKDKDVDFYRLRVGSYRVIFQKKERELIILVIRIGHRKEIYLKELP